MELLYHVPASIWAVRGLLKGKLLLCFYFYFYFFVIVYGLWVVFGPCLYLVYILHSSNLLTTAADTDRIRNRTGTRKLTISNPSRPPPPPSSPAHVRHPSLHHHTNLSRRRLELDRSYRPGETAADYALRSLPSIGYVHVYFHTSTRIQVY
jgi:hypothetical protein